MTPGSTDSLENMTPPDLIGVVRGLIGEVERLRQENGKLIAALAASKGENQQLKDEIRRLKGLPPRPPVKPSGMEKVTDRPAPEGPSEAEGSPPRRRGPGVSKLSIDRTVTLTASAPAGSHGKGYEEIIVQDIAFKPEVTLYRRERWTTPDGRMVMADPPPGVGGGCGPNLVRLVLTLHFQGQMTCERIVAVLTGAGLSIVTGTTAHLAFGVRLSETRARFDTARGAHSMHQSRHDADSYQRVELITGRRRRHDWSDDEKVRILAESVDPGR